MLSGSMPLSAATKLYAVLLFAFTIVTFVQWRAPTAPASSSLHTPSNAVSDIPAGAPGQHRVCLLFDKPPRTASSTVTFALGACWLRRWRLQAPHDVKPQQPFNQSIDWMLDLPSPFVAHYRRHVELSPENMDAITHRCDNFFYVTTTRSMRGRLRSFAKMSSGGGNLTSRNATVVLARLKKDRAVLLQRAREEEARYEQYPFKVRGTAIPPDFVIRYDQIEDDLPRLLRAFGCDGAFNTTNTHRIVDEEGLEVGDDAVSFIDKASRRGDRRHNNLTAHANSQNDQGLYLAKHIVDILKDELNFASVQ